MRRIGVLMPSDENDPDGKLRYSAVTQVPADQQQQRLFVDRPFIGAEPVLGDRMRNKVLARNLDFADSNRRSAVETGLPA